MQIISIPSVTLLCGECKCIVFYIADRRIDGVKIVKCINPECKNKGKVVKILPQIIEVEPEECVQQEVGIDSTLTKHSV